MHLLHYGVGWTPGLCDIKATVKAFRLYQCRFYEDTCLSRMSLLRWTLPALRFVSQWGLQSCQGESHHFQGV